MPGKNPHRPEGKKGADEWHRRESERKDSGRMEDMPKKPMPERDPTAEPSSDVHGGARPGVESRVEKAIEAREAREAQAEREEDH